MRSLIYKLLAYSAVLFAVDWLLPEVSLGSWQQTIWAGVVLAAVLHLLDLWLLPLFRPLRMAGVDGGLATLLLLFGANWLARLPVHSGGALLSGLLIAACAYAIHIDAVVSGRVRQ